MTSDLQLIIANEQMDKLEAYCRCCPTEIAAMGYVTNNEDGVFYVDEVFLVPQDVTSTSVDFVTKGLSWAVEKAIEDGRINDLRFCWHSHVDMGAFWSATDEGMIEDIRDSGPVPWFVSLVSNKKGESKARLDLFNPALSVNGLKHIKNIELNLYREGQEHDDEPIIAEMEQFVERKKFTPKKGKSQGPSSSAKHGSTTSGTTNLPAVSAPETGTLEGSEPVWELEAKEYGDQQAWARGLWASAARNHWMHWSDGEGWTYFFDEGDGSYKGCCLTDPDMKQPKSKADLPERTDD